MSQGVELVRTRAKSAAGFANAVLRRIVCRPRGVSGCRGCSGGIRAQCGLGCTLGGPAAWLAGEVIASLGFERARLLFDCELEPAPVAVHLNPHDATAEDVLASLRVGASDVAELPGCIAPVASSELMHTDLLKRSAVAVCDLNAGGGDGCHDAGRLPRGWRGPRYQELRHGGASDSLRHEALGCCG